MTRAELTRYIFAHTASSRIIPFRMTTFPPSSATRPTASGFALAMNIPARRLGLPSDARMDIVNLKCDPILIVSLRGAPGFSRLSHEQGKLDHRRTRRKRFR